jgi:hypothetical protein
VIGRERKEAIFIIRFSRENQWNFTEHLKNWKEKCGQH